MTQATQPQQGAGLPRIVVLDGATVNPGDNPWDGLASLGELTVHERTPADLVVARAEGAAVVLTNKTVLSAAQIAALPELRLIAVLATGTNVVDVDAAARAGVLVCNVPEYSSDSVAQHVFALLLEVTNAVGQHAEAVRAGDWQRSVDFCFWKRPSAELAGKTIGIVGLGRIGSRVARIAEAFGMKVLACSRSGTRSGNSDMFEWADIERIFAEADVVTLHCPLTEENAGFVGETLLASMREGSILINTARGPLIDEGALARALASGRPSAAALDVLALEPPADSNPLILSPHALITPHMAWSTLAARRRLLLQSAANVEAFLHGRPQNLVLPREGSSR